MLKLDLEKKEEPEIKLPISAGSKKSKGIPEKISTSASWTTLKPLTLWITTKSRKLFKIWENQTDHRPCLLTASHGQCFPLPVMLGIDRALGLAQEWAFGYITLPRYHAKVKRQVRTRHGTRDWFQFGKGVCQGCILSPCLINLYTEYIT